MRKTWNPNRRNRNIGTSKAGRGSNNKFVIPDRFKDFKIFWERIDDYKVEVREIGGREVRLIIEECKSNYIHSCTVNDITYLLSFLPEEDWAGVNLFILRQPKRKEVILSSIWGRLGYNVDIGTYKGPVIILESQDINKPLIWSKSLDPETAIELERLVQDGHQVSQDKRKYIIAMTMESVRATQLYRTLLHEIGHWVQWNTLVLKPFKEGMELEVLEDEYFRIPGSEKEAFAHRYADKLRNKLIEDKIIPFNRIDG